jgi:hypothetical protein
MRVVLDECVPRPLRRELSGHSVVTVPQTGLAGVKNGELLRRLSGSCDAFITMDKNLPSQQQLSGLPFGVIVVRTRSNRLDDLLPLIPHILAALTNLAPGDVVSVAAASRRN